MTRAKDVVIVNDERGSPEGNGRAVPDELLDDVRGRTMLNIGTSSPFDVLDPIPPDNEALRAAEFRDDGVSFPGSPTTFDTLTLPAAMVKLCRLSIPVALTQMLRNSSHVVSTAFAGYYLNPVDFASVATALTFVTLSALSVGSGVASALDSLATQEHGRRPHSPLIFRQLLQSVILSLLAFLPTAVLFLFSEPLLSHLIAEELVASTSWFLKWSFLIIIPMMCVNCLLRYAQAQCVTQLGVIVSAVGLILMLPIMWMTVPLFGLAGLLVGFALDRWLTLLATLVYCMWHPALRKCWDAVVEESQTGKAALTQAGVDADAGAGVEGAGDADASPTPSVGLRVTLMVLCEEVWLACRDVNGLVEFMRVGGPTLLAAIADSWGFETMSLVSAYLGATAAGTWAVLMTVYEQFFAPFIGMAGGTSVRIGNAIGSGRRDIALMYANATWIVSICFSVICGLGIYFSGATIYEWIQRNPEVSQRGRELIPLATIAFFCDSMFYVQQGIFRGCGDNGVSLFLVALGMWGVVVPLSFVLCVFGNTKIASTLAPSSSSSGLIGDVKYTYKWDVDGMIVALITGIAIAAPAQFIYLRFFVDWSVK